MSAAPKLTDERARAILSDAIACRRLKGGDDYRIFLPVVELEALAQEVLDLRDELKATWTCLGEQRERAKRAELELATERRLFADRIAEAVRVARRGMVAT